MFNNKYLKHQEYSQTENSENRYLLAQFLAIDLLLFYTCYYWLIKMVYCLYSNYIINNSFSHLKGYSY